MTIEQWYWAVGAAVATSACLGFLAARLVRNTYLYALVVVLAPIVFLAAFYWDVVSKQYWLYSTVGDIDGKAVPFFIVQYVVIVVPAFFAGLIGRRKWLPGEKDNAV
jgi:hypothetical protein